MRGEDDDWGLATDGPASERLRAPRPQEDDASRPTERPTTFGAIAWIDRLRFGAERVGAWIGHCYRAELEAGNRFVWAVAALAGGAASYFALPREPSLVALAITAGVATLVIGLGKCRNGVPFPVLLAATAVIGLWAVALQAHLAAAPRLDHERTVTVTGWVVDAETVQNGATRRTIEVTGMTAYRLPATAVPKRITVTFRKGTMPFAVGDGIRFMARLKPLPGPVMPGGYDFARHAYFEGRGGTGYALGRVEHADAGARPWSVWLAARIAGLRYEIAERIRAGLSGAEGAIAAAIIVGETRAIPDSENDALRMSGLPHMITIAGLHMSIVASSVFLGVRFLLSLCPAIALRFPIKRWAAAAALGAITFYVLMAGPHISAERAYVMAAIMLSAIILGRPALTMRNLALSAIVLIALNPAGVVEPGFLMSFLAVMALIAAYQALARLRRTRSAGSTRPRDRGIVLHVARSGVNHMSAAAWSSVIATLATASVTADQFYRVPPYGALTNFIVLPAIDMVAMPCAVLACLFMPFGLEAVPLALMGKAIDFMLAIGAFAAALPGGEGLIGRIHPLANLLAMFGLLWLCLWQQPWRLLGLLPVIAALGLAPFAERPDILIGEDARPIAIREASGTLRILATKPDRFTVANWLMADAAAHAPSNTRAPIDPALTAGWLCDSVGCVFQRPPTPTSARLTVAFVIDPRGFEEDCLKADIVVTRLRAPAFCRVGAEVIDRTTLDQTGALTLKLVPVAATDAGPSTAGTATTRTATIRTATGDDLAAAGAATEEAETGGDRSPSPHWRVIRTPALADVSRPWRQAPEPEAAAVPAKRDRPQDEPAADLVAPLAPEAFVRDIILGDPVPAARSTPAQSRRSVPLIDPADALDPPDLP